MKRRDALTLAALAGLPAALTAEAQVPSSVAGVSARKVLRLVFPLAESGFDPVRLDDLYSRTLTSHIFDAPLEFDYLARPVKLRARTASRLPEHSSDFRTWTFHLKPGIYFSEDAAFKGNRRELTAQDYVYSLKRFADPMNRSPSWGAVEELGILGLSDLRSAARRGGGRFDYDAEVAGLRAIGRYSFQCQLLNPSPRFPERLTDSGIYGAVAREVVEFYGDRVHEHPVGTGPFRLADWRRSSRILLERNPSFRNASWEAEPAADDVEGHAILRTMKGRRLPIVDAVDVQIIEESQPRFLSFSNGQVDVLALPQEFALLAMPGGRLAPHLQSKGIQGWRTLRPTVQLLYFNMEHPVVGGLEPHKVALRRAVCLGMNVPALISIAYRDQAAPAQSLIAPHTSGYDAAFHAEGGEYSVARARALLDVFGYVDRNGDGWRELPNGQPLQLEVATEPGSLSRQVDELLKRDMDALGLRLGFRTAQRSENLKAAHAGRHMMWRVNMASSRTDGQEMLQCLYGAQFGQSNFAHFKLPRLDAIYDRLLGLDDGPERESLFLEAKKLAIAYAPYKAIFHHYADVLAQPWVLGYRYPLFWYDWWHMVDLDTRDRTFPTA